MDLFIGTVYQFSHKNYDKTRFLLCNGQKVKKADYPKLYAKIGDLYAKDNSVAPTQDEFVIPNYVDEFLRGGNESNLGAKQQDAMQKITGSFTMRQSQAGAALIENQEGAFFIFGQTSDGSAFIQTSGETSPRKNITTFDSSRVVKTSEETRPKNISLKFAIKAI